MDDQILEHQALNYDGYIKIDNNPRYRKAREYIAHHDLKGKKILDVGCADGAFSAPLIKQGYDCYGLEFFDRAIKDSSSKGIKVTKGSFMETFPFDDDSFDCVFAGEVIEHTINDDNFLLECQRVLKPGGILILTTPNLVSLGNRYLMLMGKLPRFAYHVVHYRIYTPTLLYSKVRKAGLRIVDTDSSYVLISTFYNKSIGRFGEWLGSKLPRFGEHMIVFAKKK